MLVVLLCQQIYGQVDLPVTIGVGWQGTGLGVPRAARATPRGPV